MALKEIIAINVTKHETEENECPFCPPPEDNEKPFTTFAGDKKSNKIVDIMIDPLSLSTKNKNARPKDGGNNQQQPASSKPLPEFSHPAFGKYTLYLY
jgi:hypothetical protein